MAYQEQYADAAARGQGSKMSVKNSGINERQSNLHNWYNIIALPIVFTTNFYHLYTCFLRPADEDQYTLFSLPRQSHNVSWEICWWTFMMYICVDTVWIASFPKCVADHKVILMHHVICICGWYLATRWENWEFYVSTGIIVEFNTWLLILKRLFTEDSFTKRFIKMMDDVSWVTLRLIAFPLINYNAVRIYFMVAQMYPDGPLGGYLNTGLYGGTTSTMLMMQNLVWTRDKYFKKGKVAVAHIVDDFQNRMHDRFNLVCLPVICSLYSWHMYSLYTAEPDTDPFAGVVFNPRRQVPEGNDSWCCLWWFFWAYILVDTMWVLMYPECVASPTAIIVHHVICLIGWHMVMIWPAWEFYTSAGLVVEFNTFFLIAKRQFRSVEALHLFDNVTWIFSRLCVFPLVCWNFLCVYIHMCKTYPTFQMGFINTGLHGFLSCLIVTCQNFKWTYDKWIAPRRNKQDKGL